MDQTTQATIHEWWARQSQLLFGCRVLGFGVYGCMDFRVMDPGLLGIPGVGVLGLQVWGIWV